MVEIMVAHRQTLRILHLDQHVAGKERHWAGLVFKPQSLSQGLTSSNKTTRIPTRLYLLIVPLPGDQPFKLMCLWGTFLFKPSPRVYKENGYFHLDHNEEIHGKVQCSQKLVSQERPPIFFFNFMLPRMKLSDIGAGSDQNKAC